MIDLKKVDEAQRVISEFHSRVGRIFDKAFKFYRSYEYRELYDSWLDPAEGVVKFEYWDGYNDDLPLKGSDKFPAEWLNLNDNDLAEAAAAFWEQREKKRIEKNCLPLNVNMVSYRCL